VTTVPQCILCLCHNNMAYLLSTSEFSSHMTSLIWYDSHNPKSTAVTDRHSSSPSPPSYLVLTFFSSSFSIPCPRFPQPHHIYSLRHRFHVSLRFLSIPSPPFVSHSPPFLLFLISFPLRLHPRPLCFNNAPAAVSVQCLHARLNPRRSTGTALADNVINILHYSSSVVCTVYFLIFLSADCKLMQAL
jgi:hypothetical protein